MPKLPKGMFRRTGRPGWYIRLFRGDRERWVSLGADFAEAWDKARALAAGLPVPSKGIGTVGHAAERWVESYVRTQWNGKGLQQILGHASIETTQRYARLSHEAVMREASRLACRGVD